MKRRRKYRAVVIGCGKIGVGYEDDFDRSPPRSHAGAISADKRMELVALVDENAATLRAAKSHFLGVRTYTSAVECLSKEKPDVVVIAASTASHVSLIERACRADVKMIISEKPLCRNVSEGTRISKVLRKYRPVFVLNYQRRFFGLFERVRRDIADKKIGNVQQITCYYSNGLRNNAGHAIDSLLFLLGERITRVSGIRNKKNVIHPAGDTNIDALLETRSGIRIALQSFDQRAYAIHHMNMYGTEGAITLTDHGFTGEWSVIRRGVIPTFTKQKRVQRKDSFTKGALDEVVHCYENNSTPKSGLKNGKDVLAILDAVTRSAIRGGKATAVRYS